MRRLADLLPLIALALAFFLVFACMMEQQFEVRHSHCAGYERSTAHLERLPESCKITLPPPGPLEATSLR
ncbi:hypothetical protein HBF26_07345 [Luteibacter jiangsuensis]|uniref:Secreted protein n=1 Tax=Luteibacter jiangsuensis TaxID=637577 RepID=A0ABX0Q4M7_9GAMM|nr:MULTISPECIES: hypothetical protein [Luteibacter]NID04696.1 hypothetical protein [Luteibacter jiangsuensis]NII55602.1 hypothetical protein [Luteibacter sp. SG786]